MHSKSIYFWLHCRKSYFSFIFFVFNFFFSSFVLYTQHMCRNKCLYNCLMFCFVHLNSFTCSSHFDRERHLARILHALDCDYQSFTYHSGRFEYSHARTHFGMGSPKSITTSPCTGSENHLTSSKFKSGKQLTTGTGT